MQDGSPRGFRLPRAFWRDFAARHWEQRPLVVRAPFARPLLTEDELFAALVAASDAYRAEGLRRDVPGEQDSDLRFNVEHARLLTDVETRLPAAADGTLERYVARVTEQLGGRSFELIVHQLQGHDFAFWSRLRELFRGLYEQIGIPVEKAEAVVFLRNHEATSFGLHRDEASVFLLPVAGRKRILAWAPEVFAERHIPFCTLDYAALRERAEVLEGEPGDLLYWPSSHWHIGESVSGWSASVSLGIRLRMQPAAEVLRHVMNVYARRLGPERVATYAQRGVEETPPELTAALGVLRDVCAAPELEAMLRLAWMTRVTGFGFLKVPPPLPAAPLAEDALVRRGGDDEVVSIPWEGGLALSANGHCLFTSGNGCVTALLARINDGRTRRAGALLDACARDAGERALLRELLAGLVAIRALETANATPRTRRKTEEKEETPWPISSRTPPRRSRPTGSSAK